MMRVLSIDSVGKFLSGLFFAFIGYFTDAGAAVALVFLFIVADLISGIWVARKLKQAIKSYRLWETIPKLIWSIAVVLLAFMMDKHLCPSWLQLHKATAFLICGFEFWSILENAAKITDHPIFRYLKKFMKAELENKIGVDFNEKRPSR